MGYHVVDMSADPRCGQFAYFRRMTFPFAGITAEVDITDLMAARNGRPFFLSMLYAVTRAVNAVPQLRRRITEDGAVVEYDWCAPSYTAMKPDGVYVYCTVEGDLPYDAFIALGQCRQREVLEQCAINDCTPSYSQAWRMHKADREGTLTTAVIQAVMSEEKANQRETVKVPISRLRGVLPQGLDAKKTEDFIIKACDHYRKYLIRQRNRDER